MLNKINRKRFQKGREKEIIIHYRLHVNVGSIVLICLTQFAMQQVFQYLNISVKATLLHLCLLDSFDNCYSQIAFRENFRWVWKYFNLSTSLFDKGFPPSDILDECSSDPNCDKTI